MLGALVLNIPDIAALHVPAGTVSAGERMIAALRQAGAAGIWLVTGPEDKKAERRFAGEGVFFLHGDRAGLTPEESALFGLSHLPSAVDRVFVARSDAPLCLPETLRQLLACDAPVVIPTFEGLDGSPVLLDRESADALAAGAADLAAAVRIPVTDRGILPMEGAQEQIRQHNCQLTRSEISVSLHCGVPFFDRRLSELLHLVEETRSVRDACVTMQMSYSAAWRMLNRAESLAGFPLISRNRGGPSGQGSLLTEKGRQLLEAYDRYAAELEAISQKLYTEYFEEGWIP